MAQVQQKLENIAEKAGEAYREGRFTKQLEEQTTKFESMNFLALAVGSMILSAGLAAFSERKEYANFVGLWAPSFLLLGIYNKLAKIEGMSRET